MSCTQLLCGDTHQCLTAFCIDFGAASSHSYFRRSRLLTAPQGIFRVGKVVVGWFGGTEQEEAALSPSSPAPWFFYGFSTFLQIKPLSQSYSKG